MCSSDLGLAFAAVCQRRRSGSGFALVQDHAAGILLLNAVAYNLIVRIINADGNYSNASRPKTTSPFSSFS